MKIEFDLDDDLFARFMRSFDLVNTDGKVGVSPGARCDHLCRARILRFETEEDNRHEVERLSERKAIVFEKKKQELGL